MLCLDTRRRRLLLGLHTQQQVSLDGLCQPLNIFCRERGGEREKREREREREREGEREAGREEQ